MSSVLVNKAVGVLAYQVKLLLLTVNIAGYSTSADPNAPFPIFIIAYKES